MSRINTNVQSLIAQRVLGQNNLGLNQALERLSTGLRINRGKDDPAGLIASENLRGEQKALDQAINNSQRADQVMTIAEGGLQEVSNMLTDLQGLLTASASEAGLSKEEKQANQLQIDSILQTIDRISGATNFQGIKLLNGNFDFQVGSVSTNVADYRVNAAKFSGTSQAVNVLVTASAQQAGLFMSFGGALDLSAPEAKFVVEVIGSKGSRELSFSSGTSLANVTAAINTFTDVTGVTATASGTGIKLESESWGADELVTVKVRNSGAAAGGGIFQLNATNFNASQTSGAIAYASAGNGVTDNGQDLGATINGVTAITNGKTARVNSDFLDVEVTLGDTAASTLANVSAFSISGGGADFQLASKVDISGKVSIGIQNIAARKLGNSVTGFLDSLGAGQTNNVVDGDVTDAQAVVSEAIKQVSSIRGRIGAFQKNVVGATIRSLGVNSENTAAAQSAIRDADFAAETAQLTRSQILVSAATNVLSLANQSPQSALQLLG